MKTSHFGVVLFSIALLTASLRGEDVIDLPEVSYSKSNHDLFFGEVIGDKKVSLMLVDGEESIEVPLIKNNNRLYLSQDIAINPEAIGMLYIDGKFASNMEGHDGDWVVPELITVTLNLEKMKYDDSHVKLGAMLYFRSHHENGKFRHYGRNEKSKSFWVSKSTVISVYYTMDGDHAHEHDIKRVALIDLSGSGDCLVEMGGEITGSWHINTSWTKK